MPDGRRSMIDDGYDADTKASCTWMSDTIIGILIARVATRAVGGAESSRSIFKA